MMFDDGDGSKSSCSSEDELDSTFDADFPQHGSYKKCATSDDNDDAASKNLLSKCIIHLDIDCFYCQCEEILDPTLAKKPLAIGQKHIIVTANYVARKLGVKKLMGRNEARRVCPALTIVEGSDLEKYRKASRDVYDEFRRAVKDLGEANLAKKGSMDEMFADITVAVENQFNNNAVVRNNKVSLPPNTFVYGENDKTSVVRISEDQSGAQATISSKNNSRQDDSYINMWGEAIERRTCEEKLQVATMIGNQIRERIRSKTQFSTTIGVSVSPMLAKLACDFRVGWIEAKFIYIFSFNVVLKLLNIIVVWFHTISRNQMRIIYFIHG